MYQTPFADRIRNEAGIATIAVGAIFEADHANGIIAWSYLSPVDVNPGADGILAALREVKRGSS